MITEKLKTIWLMMSDGYRMTITKTRMDGGTPKAGKCRTLRGLNRKRVYFFRYALQACRFAKAKLQYDAPTKRVCDPKQVKSVLMLHHIGTLGDVIVETGLIRCLHQAGIQVDCLLATTNKTIIEGNPHVRHIYEVSPVSITDYLYRPDFAIPAELVATLKANQYDLVIDPAVCVHPFHLMPLLNQISPQAVVGFNRWKTVNWYAKSFDFDITTTHISMKGMYIADYLQLDKTTLTGYDLYIPDNIEHEVKAWLNQSGRKTVVVNIFGSHTDRCLSLEQLSELIAGIRRRIPDTDIVLLDHKRQITTALPDGVVVNPFTTLPHCMALIKLADYIITTDTGIVHIAATWRKPALCIYRDITVNNRLWGPGYPEATQLIVGSNRISEQPELVAKILDAIPEFI